MRLRDGVSERSIRRRIGDILVSEGKTTGEQFEKALEVQKTDKRHLGKILISLGYTTPDDLAQALSLGLDIRVRGALRGGVDPEVFGLRKAESRIREAPLEAMGSAISAVISLQDARGFFNHCGHDTQVQSLRLTL